MKVSNYNVFVHNDIDNVYIGYNCVSGGLYVFNETQYNSVKTILSNPNSNSATKVIKDKLVKGRFLIDRDVDELKMLKLRNNMAKYNPNGLGMVVAPTLSCNFDCPYCYVDKKDKVIMNQKTMNAVKNFFSKKTEKIDNAAVCWTGGEPLLALDVVEYMNSYFQEESKRKKVGFTSSMITNGYLLEPEIVDRLKKCGIQVLQITIDGFREYHDKLRHTLDGKKTYVKILENVIKASNSGMKIILRSNVEKENYGGIYQLIDELAESELNKDNVFYAPCMIMDVKTSKGHYRGNYFSNSEFSKIEPEIIRYSIKKGFKINKSILSTYSTYCGANTLSFYVLNPHANILRCWCNLGRADKNKVGCIEEDGEVFISDYKNLVRWMSWDPFEIEECRKCKVLPICMGGCMYYNIMGETDVIEIGCSLRKYNLEEMIKLFYYYSATVGNTQLKSISLLNNPGISQS